MAYRFALYLAPAPGSELHGFASEWLGRDPATGATLPQPAIPYVDPFTFKELTASPRRYGFHATIKPPFRLAPGRTAEDFMAAAERFAASHAPFDIELEVQSLRGFLAFLLRKPSTELDDLADACVREFEPFRARLSEAELERRKRSALSPRQLDHLDQWGYPYVFEDFVFHMTLTDRLMGNLHDRLLVDLCGRTRPITSTPLHIDALSVFEEPQHGAPFRLAARLPFGAR